MGRKYFFLQHNYLNHKKGMDKLHYLLICRTQKKFSVKTKNRAAEGIMSHNKKGFF
jgi:hypothetical protein